MVALEWAATFPERTRAAVVFAAPAAHTAWAIGWNHVQRQAIEAAAPRRASRSRGWSGCSRTGTPAEFESRFARQPGRGSAFAVQSYLYASRRRSSSRASTRRATSRSSARWTRTTSAAAAAARPPRSPRFGAAWSRVGHHGRRALPRGGRAPAGRGAAGAESRDARLRARPRRVSARAGPRRDDPRARRSNGTREPVAPRSVLRRRRRKRNRRLLLRRPRRDEEPRAGHAGLARGREVAALDRGSEPVGRGLADREDLVVVELQDRAAPSAPASRRPSGAGRNSRRRRSPP